MSGFQSYTRRMRELMTKIRFKPPPVVLPGPGLNWVTVVDYDFAQVPPETPANYQSWTGFVQNDPGVYSDTTQQIVDASLSLGGSANACRCHFRTGLPGGYSPVLYNWGGVVPANNGNFDLTYTFKLAPNWLSANPPGVKQWFFGRESVNNHFVQVAAVDWNSNAQLTLMVGLQSPFNSFYTDKVIVPGVAYKVRVLGLANTPGTANGQMQIWVDDLPVQFNNGVYGPPNRTIANDIMFFSSGQTALQNRNKFNATWGGSVISPTVATYMDIGHYIMKVA